MPKKITSQFVFFYITCAYISFKSTGRFEGMFSVTNHQKYNIYQCQKQNNYIAYLLSHLKHFHHCSYKQYYKSFNQ